MVDIYYHINNPLRITMFAVIYAMSSLKSGTKKPNFTTTVIFSLLTNIYS